ncbi:MAG: sporulation integral membrane protein YtvI [Eubacteriales bacterium]|nr:sporulation integral membrane protein YtvI [Eubacteriales bacterium]
MHRRQLDFLVRLAYAFAIVALLWLSLRYFLLWLLPFLLAMGIAALLEPLIDAAQRRLHFKRSFIAAVLTLVLLGSVIALLAWLVSQLFLQASSFLEQLPSLLSRLPNATADLQRRMDDFCAACPLSLRTWVDGFLTNLSTQAVQLINNFSAACLRWLTSAITHLPRIFLFCATTVLAVFFTTAAYPTIMDFLRRQMRPSGLNTARGVKANLFSTLGKWCKAQCILLTITCSELFVGFLLLRQNYALLLAVLIALIDALPVFGTGTVLIPWALLCILAGNIPRGIALAALYAVITLVRSITEPHVMAAQVGLPPLMALLAMYVGFCTFQVVGMILFPMALLFIKQLHDSGYLKLWK